jgi:hypothetical protein
VGRSGSGYRQRLAGNTPEAFRESLAAAGRFLDRSPAHPKILNSNPWNEWTKDSYLEPDTEHGMGYLEAIDQVFGRPAQ